MDKGRVLIVEDEALIAMELKDRLERNHYTVCGVVARGEEAINRIEQFNPDVALMDVHLAGSLDGIETAKQLRAKMDIPVVYVTAYSDPLLVEQAVKTEAYGYLVKPFDERELRATIDLALYKHMMEQRVRENERRLAALFDQSTVGMAEINAHTGCFLRVNPRYREIGGYGPEALSVTDSKFVTNQDDLAKEQEQLRALKEGRLRDFSMDKRCTRPDGSERWISQTLSPLWEAGKEPTSYVLVAQDVTERKMAETALVQEQKLESLASLAAGLAHDVNNLLQGILGHTDVARTKLGPEHEVHGSLRRIEATVDKAAELVRQLMVYAGITRVVPTSVELCMLIRKTLASMAATISPAVNLVVDDSGDEEVAEGDPGQIQEVLVNLLWNAVEAIGEGEGEVRIRSSTRSLTDRDLSRWSVAGLDPSPGRYAILEIKDSGCGIAPESLGKLFDPFYTTKFLGRGLGLSMVLGIVRRHRGGICIDSMPGFGTTVSVAFPAVSPTASVIETNRLPKKSGAVLLIDDDTLVQEFVTSVLAQHGMTAVTASSVERGVELLRERQRDIALVLVDIDMRGVSGAMVVRRLREITSEVAIVIISGYAEREALIMTGVERVSGFLPKPYTHGMLLGEVRKFISP